MTSVAGGGRVMEFITFGLDGKGKGVGGFQRGPENAYVINKWSLDSKLEDLELKSGIFLGNFNL